MNRDTILKENLKGKSKKIVPMYSFEFDKEGNPKSIRIFKDRIKISEEIRCPMKIKRFNS